MSLPTVHLTPMQASLCTIPATGKEEKVRIIGLAPGKLLMEEIIVEVPVVDGALHAAPAATLLRSSTRSGTSDRWSLRWASGWFGVPT